MHVTGQSIMSCMCASASLQCASTKYVHLTEQQHQLVMKRAPLHSVHHRIPTICHYHYNLYIHRYAPSKQCIVCESNDSALRECPKWLCKQLSIDDDLSPYICWRPCYEEKLSEKHNSTAAISPDVSHYTVTIEESSTPSKVRMHNTLFYTIIETHSVFIQHTTCSTKK